jgi:hypothetical protein
MLFVTSRHYIFEDSVLNLSEKSGIFNKAYEVNLRGLPSTFLNVEANEQLCNMFLWFWQWFSNQSGAREINWRSLVLTLEGPWIYSRNLTTHLIFCFWE